MRFAPPPSVRVAEHPSGMNQVLARSFNERLIMSLLLQHGGMTRFELGQKSGLSAQTISVIVRALERDSLICKGEAVRGRIGPPTTPISLNPEGVFSVGLHVDQDSIEAVLINFTGEPVTERAAQLERLDIASVEAGLLALLQTLMSDISPESRELVTGIGLTLPREFDPANPGQDAVLSHDFESALRAQTGLEIFIQNDITATASAEILYGRAKLMDDHLFCYVSDDLKPRLVLGGRIYSGAAPHSPICDGDRWNGTLRALEAGAGPSDEAVRGWIAQSAEQMSRLIEDLARFASVPTMILAAPVSPPIMTALVAETSEGIAGGLAVEASSLGPHALALGAATLPIHSRFTTEAG